MTPGPSANPKPRHRWLQFSLRTLLLSVLVAGFGLGWLASELKQASVQRQAVLALRRLGGQVVYDRQQDPAPVPEWLRERLGDDMFGNVTEVVCYGSQVTDEGLEHLQG